MSARDGSHRLLDRLRRILDRVTGANEGEDAADSSLDEAGPDVTDEWSIKTIVSTMLPLLALTSLLQMGSGTVLESFQQQLLDNPSLLVLVPVQIGTAGNLGSIMGSRLSTQLHLGTLELDPQDPDIRANVGAVLGLATTVFLLLGISAWAIGQVLGGSLALGQVLAISMISGMLLALWVIVVSITAVWLSYRLGYNPDDITLPIVTNICDITGVLILFGVVTVLL